MKWIVLILLVLLFSVNAYGDVRYNITDVGGQYASCVNDSRQVVGSFYDPTSGNHFFLWQNGSLSYLGGLSNAATPWGSVDINNNGQIVGSSVPLNGSDWHATLWNNGSIIDLMPNSAISSAEAINNHGLIVGWENWYTGFITSVNGGWKTTIDNFNAFAVNDNGYVVGRTFASDGERAALWTEPGGLQDIDPSASLWGLNPLPTNQSRATSIDAAGQIFGVKYMLDSNQSYVQRSWMLDSGKYYDLGNIGYPHANNKGQVVGGSFLWENGNLYGLTALIAPDSGWSILHPQWINNNGDIVGYGLYNGQQSGFLMTSVPEPPSILALCGGVVGLLALHRRRK